MSWPRPPRSTVQTTSPSTARHRSHPSIRRPPTTASALCVACEVAALLLQAAGTDRRSRPAASNSDDYARLVCPRTEPSIVGNVRWPATGGCLDRHRPHLRVVPSVALGSECGHVDARDGKRLAKARSNRSPTKVKDNVGEPVLVLAHSSRGGWQNRQSPQTSWPSGSASRRVPPM